MAELASTHQFRKRTGKLLSCDAVAGLGDI